MRRMLVIALVGVLVIGYVGSKVTTPNHEATQGTAGPTKTVGPGKWDWLHLDGGDITKANYRAGVDLALRSPAVLSGDFGACAYYRWGGGPTDLGHVFGNQIPGEPSDMAGWISVPGQEDKDAMYSMIAQTIINEECAKVFK